MEHEFYERAAAGAGWFRLLTIVDQFTRECLASSSTTLSMGTRWRWCSRNLVAERGAPLPITADVEGGSEGNATTF